MPVSLEELRARTAVLTVKAVEATAFTPDAAIISITQVDDEHESRQSRSSSHVEASDQRRETATAQGHRRQANEAPRHERQPRALRKSWAQLKPRGAAGARRLARPAESHASATSVTAPELREDLFDVLLF